MPIQGFVPIHAICKIRFCDVKDYLLYLFILVLSKFQFCDLKEQSLHSFKHLSSYSCETFTNISNLQRLFYANQNLNADHTFDYELNCLSLHEILEKGA